MQGNKMQVLEIELIFAKNQQKSFQIFFMEFKFPNYITCILARIPGTNYRHISLSSILLCY